jgi:hypothetical protein
LIFPHKLASIIALQAAFGAGKLAKKKIRGEAKWCVYAEEFRRDDKHIPQ